MDDLEICRRIAEIEGIEFKLEGTLDNGTILKNEGNDFHGHTRFTIYDPIKNKGLCFKLMIDYCVNVEFFDGFSGRAYISHHYGLEGEHYFNEENEITNAICLAIIEAYENE